MAVAHIATVAARPCTSAHGNARRSCARTTKRQNPARIAATATNGLHKNRLGIATNGCHFGAVHHGDISTMPTGPRR